MVKTIFGAVSAGIMIAIGGSVFLSCDVKYVGAVLFSVALLCICYLGYYLFTGKIGYLADDFSKNSLKPVLAAAHSGDVRTFKINRSKEELSLALGKLCGVVSVEDKGFAQKLAEIIENEQGGELYDKI